MIGPIYGRGFPNEGATKQPAEGGGRGPCFSQVGVWILKAFGVVFWLFPPQIFLETSFHLATELFPVSRWLVSLKL